jgi:hypothetical protein
VALWDVSGFLGGEFSNKKVCNYVKQLLLNTFCGIGGKFDELKLKQSLLKGILRGWTIDRYKWIN